ncbi:ABC-2 type transport system ATP-binding protein [Ekhidna lutea]|uniref:ABC-2 type transport system ATP-binding protein n=1 Tax=Ekhidna lutea TaxID=447679 RepID=A0A239L545_EKHLU|nr:gliding motility-associated ABC transporter ATP-binding subunit GldA [Ekhidna lutea]SNT25028.1 ABC-2 type transport system ATP-binding protein [Ekhidna lutea]
MSIVVDNLTKVYGSQKALDSISFEASEGRITGFLGPNGAGKSTTMKIATGFIGLTSGSVSVNGIDVTKEPLQVKRITGYLPEHNPLYLEMYVKEYLGFIASSYGLKDKKNRVESMIEMCGLGQEQHKKIGALSKGFRQRVGLAQALIHDPKVLILDEPTSGLDPNQLVEIRKVIKEASKDKTVILSTHIMQEVEALCDKVVIVNKGKIVADDEVGNLKAMKSDQISYQVEFEEGIDQKLFEKEGLTITNLENFVYQISADEDPRKVIMKVTGDHALPLINISKVEQSLEGVFQELTKGA